MKKKLIASLVIVAIAALAIMPAALAAPANCPLKNAAAGDTAITGNTDSMLNQLLGSKGNTGNVPACPKTAALQDQLNGANTGSADAAPATLQQLLGNLGNKPACQQQNDCTTAACPTGDCQSGNCLTADCSTGTCPNK